MSNNTIKRFTSTCKVCNKDFVYESVNRRAICSDACRYEQKRQSWHKYNKSRQKKDPNRICVICSKPFVLSDKELQKKQSLTCSDECRLERKREKSRLWQRKKLAEGGPKKKLPPPEYVPLKKNYSSLGHEQIRYARNDVDTALRNLGLL